MFRCKGLIFEILYFYIPNVDSPLSEKLPGRTLLNDKRFKQEFDGKNHLCFLLAFVSVSFCCCNEMLRYQEEVDVVNTVLSSLFL